MYSTIKESIASARRLRASYAIMDQESENEDEEEATSHSLFYSVQQDQHGEESIPLTDSQAYSDRSQLAFDLTDDDAPPEEHGHPQQHSDSHPQVSLLYLPSSRRYTGLSDRLLLVLVFVLYSLIFRDHLIFI